MPHKTACTVQKKDPTNNLIHPGRRIIFRDLRMMEQMGTGFPGPGIHGKVPFPCSW